MSMMNQSRILSLVASGALLLSISSGVTVSATEQCATEGEQPLEFRFFTDNNSWMDNGWVLECDYEDDRKELVWEVPIGSLKFQPRTEVIREAACIPDTATCYLNIFDTKGDGLQGSTNGDPSSSSFEGWFAFLHGATTVATYKNMEEPKFSELSYCVGPKCDQKPQEIQTGDVDCQDIVYLAMQLDNTPQDTSYQLICGGEGDGVFDKQIIWDGSGFTKAGEYIEQESCLPKDACCEFIVVDGKSNGLTEEVDVAVAVGRSGSDSDIDSSNVQPRGFIYLEHNGEPVLQYDGETGETFGVLTKQFACGADKTSINKDQNKDGRPDNSNQEDVILVATEEVNIPEEFDEYDTESTDDSSDNDGDSDSNSDGDSNSDSDSEVEEEVQVEDTENGEELVIEVGDNVEGVFDPEAQEESKNVETQSSSSISGTNLQWDYDDDDSTFDDGYYVGDSNPFGTEEPTSWTSEGSSTEAPTIDTTLEDWFQNVPLDDDDTAWADDDAAWIENDGIPPVELESPQNAMNDIDGMIQDLTDSSPNLPSDPIAVAFLNGQPVYENANRKVGLTKGAKITIGILVPLLSLWAIGLAVYYFQNKQRETDSEDDADASEGKDTIGDVASDVSLSGQSIHSLKKDNIVAVDNV